MHTVLSNFDALQKIKQAAAATSIKRLEDLTTLQYSSVAAMFDRVAELREADDLVGEPRDSSTYLQFILRKLPRTFRDLKENIPADPVLFNDLGLAREKLEERERNLLDEEQSEHTAHAVAGEGMHGGGGNAFAFNVSTFTGDCYRCGQKGHKSYECTNRQQHAQHAQHSSYNNRGRAQWRGNGGRGRHNYGYKRQYQPQHQHPQQQNHNSRGHQHNHGNRTPQAHAAARNSDFPPHMRNNNTNSKPKQQHKHKQQQHPKHKHSNQGKRVHFE
jgi:hypothetical protein